MHFLRITVVAIDLALSTNIELFEFISNEEGFYVFWRACKICAMIKDDH